MPRARGQIDTRKHEAILDAAVEVLSDRGIHAPIEEVARRAGVSKQTIYNHYGSKTELVRTLVERRRERVMAPLERPGAEDHPEATLTAYAQVILELISSPSSTQFLKMAIAGATEMPDLSRTIYESGIRAARVRLSEYLAGTQSDRLSIPDPDVAAETFMGMIMGGVQIRLLIGLDSEILARDIPERAREQVARFMRAYASGVL